MTEPLAPVEPLAEPPTEHDLAVDGLSFRFAESEPWVLRDLDLRVGAGERVALVGPSGSGKSTLVSLLLRFWDYETGSIRLGDRELHELEQDAVREQLAVVPQDVHLFNATIEDNLLLADAHATREEIERAVEETFHVVVTRRVAGPGADKAGRRRAPRTRPTRMPAPPPGARRGAVWRGRWCARWTPAAGQARRGASWGPVGWPVGWP